MARGPSYKSLKPDESGQESEDLSEQEKGGTRDREGAALLRPNDDGDDDEEDGDETELEKELEEMELVLGGERVHRDHPADEKRWYRRLPSLRTTLLTLFSITILALLIALFHPQSPFKKAEAALKDWYQSGMYGSQVHGQDVGTWDANGVVVEGPNPTNSKFGDVPFASLDTSSPTYSSISNPSSSSNLKDQSKTPKTLLSNGTHSYEKTVILVSLDGVRADYLTRGLTPHLLSVAKKGLRSEYLQPVFPSLTFPNHWSLMTGLYPASHGIVANDFWDPDLGKEFIYTEPTKSWPAEWWGGEPIWETVVKAGKRSAVMMWPGPPEMASKVRPSLWYPFQNKFHYSRKLAKVADWLDMPLDTRPHFIAVYAPEVDQEGHRTGPHSHKVNETLLEMDDFAKGMWNLLEERNLTDVVDVVFVSDHGMTSTHNERLVFLDDILGKDNFKAIERNEGWPSAGLRFQPHIDTALMLTLLQNASMTAQGGFHVYTHDTMPERWHFAGNERIAPIYVVPHTGWAISDRHDFHVTMKGDYVPKGNHGYDNEDPSMHAIFVAHGPFASSIKTQIRKRDPNAAEVTVIPGFANLEIYNLATKLLELGDDQRAPTNGTKGYWEGVF